MAHAIIGAVAGNAYGLRRATQGVDVLVNSEQMHEVQRVLSGRGWAPRYPGSQKLLTDVTNRVEVDLSLVEAYLAMHVPVP